MEIPRLVKVRQFFNREHIEDIEGRVREEIFKLGLSIKPGSEIAIAVGSRGIRNIDRIVKTTVDVVKEFGGKPFIVPAMGSHGGATAEGQKKLLEGYGIREDLIGAPIKSSLEVVELPSDGLENRVFIDKIAYSADGTIIINRIKPHTDFHSDVESGLLKMCVIGLGKHKQAIEIHRFGTYGLRHLIPPTAERIIQYGNIIFGIGIVENAYDETMIIEAVEPKDFEETDKRLLKIARENMPALPVDRLDVLIVDEMGKDISGAGMDTNIIGRIYIDGEPEPERPKITRIVVTDLTEKTHGNAIGMGLADFITKRLFSKIDFDATYQNAVTSTFVLRGKVPIITKDSRTAIEWALRTCGPIEIERAKIIRIKNTLSLSELYVSESVLAEIKDRVEVIGDFVDICDESGELIPF
ncbi:MAG: DUF2088 domain-containing protein [bacterium]|nr:DUF2088 domain-containing protein [bacterium]